MSNPATESFLQLFEEVVQNFFSPQSETGRMDGGVSLLMTGDGAGRLSPVGPRESGLLVPGDAKALAACDLNRDGWPDLAITRNNDSLILFEHRGVPGRNSLAIRLTGKPGNPTAAGARVTVRRGGGQRQTAELHAGAGYLSQSAPVLFFGRDENRAEVAVTVRWPDGVESTHRIGGQENYAVLHHPATSQ